MKILTKFRTQIPLLRSELRGISLDAQLLDSRLQTVVAETRMTRSPTNPSTGLVHPTSSVLSGLTETPGFPDSVLHVRAALHRVCNPLCICRCHHPIKIKSPSWLQSFLGLVYVGYSGAPLLPGRSCDQKSCEKQSSSVLILGYSFPSWFIHRMILFRNQSTPRDGHMLSVRTPRIVSNGSEIFYACKLGKVNEIRRLFAEGLASPFDADYLGQTPLSVGLAHF